MQERRSQEWQYGHSAEVPVKLTGCDCGLKNLSTVYDNKLCVGHLDGTIGAVGCVLNLGCLIFSKGLASIRSQDGGISMPTRCLQLCFSSH